RRAVATGRSSGLGGVLEAVAGDGAEVVEEGDAEGGAGVEPELVAEAGDAAGADLDPAAIPLRDAGDAEAGADEEAADDEDVGLDVAAEEHLGAEAARQVGAEVEVGAESEPLGDAATERELDATGRDEGGRLVEGLGEQRAGDIGGAEAEAGPDVKAAAVLRALDLNAATPEHAGLGDRREG